MPGQEKTVSVTMAPATRSPMDIPSSVMTGSSTCFMTCRNRIVDFLEPKAY
ncbi:hypothetical protein D3C81_2107650 [compost metagenome]